jgi:WD40 repeat protein
VVDAATGRELLAFGTNVYHVAFSPDGRRLVTGGDLGQLQTWDSATGKELLNLKGFYRGIIRPVFSRDGQRIAATGYGDGKIRIWDAETGRELVSIGVGYHGCVVFSPDGRRILTGDMTGLGRLWDAVSGRELLPALFGHGRGLFAVAFSADGRRIATGGFDETIRVWDADSRRELLILRGHTNAVYSLAFSEDGQRLVSGSGDGTARIWQAATPKQVASWQDEDRAIGKQQEEMERAWEAAWKKLDEIVTADDGRIKRWLVLAPISYPTNLTAAQRGRAAPPGWAHQLAWHQLPGVAGVDLD